MAHYFDKSLQILTSLFFIYTFFCLISSEILLHQAFEEIGVVDSTRNQRFMIFFDVYKKRKKLEILENNYKFKIVIILVKIFRYYVATIISIYIFLIIFKNIYNSI